MSHRWLVSLAAAASLYSIPSGASAQSLPLAGRVTTLPGPEVTTGCATPKVTYYGGRVISNVQVVQVNWSRLIERFQR